MEQINFLKNPNFRQNLISLKIALLCGFLIIKAILSIKKEKKYF